MGGLSQVAPVPAWPTTRGKKKEFEKLKEPISLNFILTPLLMILVSLITKWNNNGKPRVKGLFPSIMLGLTHFKDLQTPSLYHKLPHLHDQPHLLPKMSPKGTLQGRMTRGGVFSVKGQDALRPNALTKELSPQLHIKLSLRSLRRREGGEKELYLNEPLDEVEEEPDEGKLLMIRRP